MVGIAVGGFVVMPLAVLLAATIGERFTSNAAYGFAVIYVGGFALGVWGVALARRRIDFMSGLVTGSAAGLLGLTALCNAIIGGLGNMH